MITTIRSQFKQATYRYIVFFMVFIIAASMLSSLLVKTDRMQESWAVRVNGVEIPYQDFNQEVAKQTEYLAHIRAQYGQYADLLLQSMGWAIDPKVRALDILVKEELISQYGKKLGLVISGDYVASRINDAQFVKQYLGHIIPPFAYDQAGTLDMNVITSFLKQRGISPQQFEQSIEKALIQVQVMEIVSQAQIVPQFDVKQQFIAHNLGKQFSCLLFSLDTFIAQEKKKSVSQDELQSFYDAQNKQYRRYWVPEKRNGLIWKIEPQKYNIAISDEEIERYYEDNKVKSYVLDPLKVEIQKIVQKDDSVDLNAIRKALLDNPKAEAASKWQSVKPFARGEHKGELEKEAFTLQNEGDISPVFETAEGPTIIKLVKRIPRTYKPLATVKKDIKDILTVKAFKKSFAKDIKAIAQGDMDAIEAFMMQKAGKKETLSGIMKDESRLSQELFGLKQGRYARLEAQLLFFFSF